MHDLQNIGLFLVAGIALNLTPGADMLYIIDRGVSRGALNGIAAALGIAAGSLVHLALAVIGIATVLANSPVAMFALKIIGALYLIWLGISLCRSNPILDQKHTTAATAARSRGLTRDFITGVAVNVLNPKIALFFLAFLPQFIVASPQSPTAALIILGILFNVTGTTWNIIVALGAAWFRTRLRDGARIITLFPRIAGVLMMIIGMRLLPIAEIIANA